MLERCYRLPSTTWRLSPWWSGWKGRVRGTTPQRVIQCRSTGCLSTCWSHFLVSNRAHLCRYAVKSSSKRWLTPSLQNTTKATTTQMPQDIWDTGRHGSCQLCESPGLPSAVTLKGERCQADWDRDPPTHPLPMLCDLGQVSRSLSFYNTKWDATCSSHDEIEWCIKSLNRGWRMADVQ